jgi:hypothetical protein
MRINLAHNVKGAKLAFLKHVLQLVADEFDISMGALRSHLTSGDPQVGEYVTNWLSEQGWQVTWYQMPRPGDEYFDSDHGEFMWLSFGFCFSDTCDKLITWRLSNP